ncbi:hypothetical protein [Streptomyces sp. NL15-2K]|uniref:hypothetical protein n=1 Tax=Streptomyces sp. NL15-2K TaxID=376149 RepID=UPI000F563D17|nr:MULTISPECIES: hypothetical protein [Actinomycetes]WKX11731.1 hypothetical protein Q4V64_31195 [Kutzneria buriramensis]GCB46783.1 hypothetical protein SNL152K_4081 [Streptomyces sp. NL15-2K]
MDDHAYSFLVCVNNPVPVSDPQSLGLPPDAEMASTIRLSTARRPGDTPLARIFAPRSGQRGNRKAPPPFWIQDGPGGRPWCSVHPAAPDIHEVHAVDATPLATITRHAGRLSPWPRRVRWSARFAHTPQPVTGKEGTWYAWFTYVVTAPFWFLFALCTTVYAYFDGTTDDYTFKRPLRTRWRGRGTGTVLDYRGVSNVYRFDPRHLDARVAYALAVLQTWEDKG